MISWPDAETYALPTRAYLRSVVDQTIPARRLALVDSIDHFRQAQTSDDRGWSDMAFLGVIAEALQVLEDLAYVGESFTVNRFGGLPFYVGAITYTAVTPTTFYTRNRTDDDLRVLAGFAVKDQASGQMLNIADEFLSGDRHGAVRAAWRKAEDATIIALRSAIIELADTWSRFSKYFHAFKHGGLVAHRNDLEVSEGGAVLDPAIAVWIRKKVEPQVHGAVDSALNVPAVVDEIELQARIAADVLEIVVGTRLGMAEQAVAGPPPEGQETVRITVPVRFRVGGATLNQDERQALEELGIRFADGPGRVPLDD
jgi:hypothetical protein